jgi:pimeloyl-ACP methyl ester carboxylesterase
MLHAILYVIVMTVLVACSVPRSATWLPDERTGLGRGEGALLFGKLRLPIKALERVIRVPLDKHNGSSGKFDLYYFVRRPSKERGTKTVLFIAGGPGRFNPGPFGQATMADFLLQNGEYNVVHFHARGAGDSQIPPHNYYDRFLKTSHVAKDIEAIREDLTRLGYLDKEGRWDAVIGYSYGTVVAQQYAGAYPHNVKKMILIGVESRHLFENSDQAFSQITSEIRETNRYTLAKIFEAADFKDLSPDKKARILDSAFGTEKTTSVFQKAEDFFGSLPFLISAYCEPEVRRYLKASGLDRYSVGFFQALRALRDVGWHQRSADRDDQIRWAKRIRVEIEETEPIADSCRNTTAFDETGSSERVFYVVTAFDGISLRLLDALKKSERPIVSDALRRSGGSAHYEKRINKFLEKVGIADDETIVPWNPAKHQYDGPTMILKGSADTVGAGGAAEHFFIDALTGARVLIMYPGIGHGYRLPLMFLRPLPKTFPSTNICELDDLDGATRGIRDCLIYSFLEMTPDAFIDSTDNKVLPIIISDGASVCFRDGSNSRDVAGKCP